MKLCVHVITTLGECSYVRIHNFLTFPDMAQNRKMHSGKRVKAFRFIFKDLQVKTNIQIKHAPAKEESQHASEYQHEGMNVMCRLINKREFYVQLGWILSFIQ